MHKTLSSPSKTTALIRNGASWAGQSLKTRTIFAVITAILMTMLMCTAVFAYTGNGTEDFPYVVTTFDELKICMKNGGYVELGADISETFDSEHYSNIKISVTSETHLDFCGYTVNANVITDNGQTVPLFNVSKSTLYIDDSGIDGGVYLKCTSMGKTSESEVVWCNYNGKLVVNGGNLINESGSVIVGQLNEGAFPKVTINGGYLYSTEAYGITRCFDLTINGGTLKSVGQAFCDWSPGMFGYDGILKINGGEIDGIYIYPKSVQPQIKNCIIHKYVQINVAYKIDYAFSYFSPTVIVDGEEKGYDELKTLNILKGTNIVVSVPEPEQEGIKCKLNKDVTPRAGEAAVLPTVPDDAKYRITSAKWMNTSAEEVTSFSTGGGTYYLIVEAEIIDTDNDKFISTPVLSETTGNYTVTKAQYNTAKTKLSAAFKFVMKPVITQQPQDVTVNKAGDTAEFNVVAYNTDSYQWYLTDKNGHIIDWQTAADNNIASVVGSTTGNTLKITALSTDIDLCRVYCVLSFNGNTTRTQIPKINWSKYAVSFDANGGTGTMDNQFAYANTPFVLPECNFTNNTYFYKWDIDGQKYAVGEEIIITEATTLKAYWYNCYVRYYSDTGGGIKYVSIVVPYGKEYTLCTYEEILAQNSSFTGPANTKFDHWRVNGKDYAPGDKIAITSTYTDVYAVYVYSSNCGADGDNCTWKLDYETGVLTISGSGKMKDYSAGSSATCPPWYDQRSKIKTVVVENGVTRIGNFAFGYCKNLTTVNIADSVTHIGSHAFKNSGITKINIPSGVRVFVNDAFINTPMTYITIPKNVSGISDHSIGYTYDSNTNEYTKVDGFIICGYAGTKAQTYADTNKFDFIQLGNVTGEDDHTVNDADAALLLKYLNGKVDLETRQLVAARATDSTKDEPDMLDVIWTLNHKTE